MFRTGECSGRKKIQFGRRFRCEKFQNGRRFRRVRVQAVEGLGRIDVGREKVQDWIKFMKVEGKTGEGSGP